MRAALGIGLIAAVSFAIACSDDPAASLGDAGNGGADSATDDAALGADTGGNNNDAGGNGQDAAVADSGIMDDCNPVTQTGCPPAAIPAATKCVVEPEMLGQGAHCVPPGNDGNLGDMCTGEDCMPTLACAMTSTTGSTCVQVCDLSTGTPCQQLGNDFDCRSRISQTNWGACVMLGPICNPLDARPREAILLAAPPKHTPPQVGHMVAERG